MATTEELLEKVQKFKFDSKLFDLGVYSRQYLSNILFWKYSEFNKNLIKDDFTVIFGDFNKLSAINKKYSDKAGDEAIYTAMSLIKKNLPANAKIARVAGDEIIMIIENLSKEDANKCIDSINKDLESSLNAPYNLTISLAASHSSEKKGIEEMYEEAEASVSASKLISKQDSLSNDKILILKEKISKDFENYFSLFRFSKEYTLSLKKLKSIMKRTLNSIISVIEFDEISTIQQTPLELRGSPINKLRAKLVDDELSKENVIPESFSEPLLSQVLDSLLREPISNQYSRRCLDECLLESERDPNFVFTEYNAIQFSTSFLKLSNSISGHIKTDNEIRSLSNNLYNKLSEYIKFDPTVLCKNHNNVLLDVGGADFLAVYDKDLEITPEEMDKILEEVNSTSSTLKLSAYMSKEPITIKTASSFLQEAAIESQKTKDKLKESRIPTEESQKALDLLLADCLVYYKDNFKTSSLSHNTMDGQVKFMNLLFGELLSSAFKVFYPEKMSENIFSDDSLGQLPKQLVNEINTQSINTHCDNFDDEIAH